MHTVRIIPRLDIKGPNLVKGIHLEGLRVLGKPWDFAYTYYKEGADELIFIDAVASLYGRNNLLDIVRKTAEKIFIPLTVGGGVRSVDDVRNLLRAGADKVAINTAAVSNPQLITDSAMAFGSQCIVGSLQVKKIDNRYFVFTDNARERTQVDAIEWAHKLVELGAGELLITSIDKEGTGNGYETDLTALIAPNVPVPVIACGGCASPEHMAEVISKGQADAVAASSIFHYKYAEQINNSDEFRDEGNLAFIKNARGGLSFMKNRLKASTIHEVKTHLNSQQIFCRK
jgi:cyclase